MTRLLVHVPFYTLGLALWFSALAAGGIHMPVLVTFAALITASGLFARFSTSFQTEVPSPWHGHALAAIAGTLAIYCLLQALPLPVHWLEALAPRNADIWARSLKPFALPAPELASISLAPGRSVIEALKFATYGLVFAVAARSSRQYGFQRMAGLAFVSALAVASVTAAHQLVGAERLYGQYSPLNAYSVAPLLNPNNRAGYLNLGFFCGLGLLFRTESRPYLGLVAVGLCFIAAEVLLCRSLGGSACLAIGWGLVALLALPGVLRPRGNRRDLGLLGRIAVLGVVGAGAVVLAIAGRGSGTFGLDARSWQKVDLWRRAAKLASDHFVLGVGRGAFASVFAAYQEPGRNLVYEHAENFPIHWAAEWGVPITVLALLGLAWCLAPLFSRSTLSSSTRRCALIGCGVLLLQNLADLALEVPAVMALLCCVLGALRGSVRNGQPQAARRAASALGRGVLLASSGLTVLCIGLAVSYGSESPARLRHDLFQQLSSPGPVAEPFWRDLERAVRAYPAEPYFPLLGSSAALTSGGNPFPWISRSLERNPESPVAHLQLARILRANGSLSQAFGALRQAFTLDPTLITRVPALAMEWRLSLPEFEDAAPLGRAGVPLLTLLADRANDVPQRLGLLDRALARDPDAADVHYRMAQELLHDFARKDRGVVCPQQRDDCAARIAEHTRLAASPGDSRTVVLEASLLAELGQTVQAEEHLAQACGQFPGDVKCLTAWVTRALNNNGPRLQEAINALVAAGCTGTDDCASIHLVIGNLFANAGRWHTALSHFEHAAQEASTSEAWQAVARAAERLGDNTTAHEARRRVALLSPGHASIGEDRAPSTTLLTPTQGTELEPHPESGATPHASNPSD